MDVLGLQCIVRWQNMSSFMAGLAFWGIFAACLLHGEGFMEISYQRHEIQEAWSHNVLSTFQCYVPIGLLFTFTPLSGWCKYKHISHLTGNSFTSLQMESCLFCIGDNGMSSYAHCANHAYPFEKTSLSLYPLFRSNTAITQVFLGFVKVSSTKLR